jgi:hypothetical protein
VTTNVNGRCHWRDESSMVAYGGASCCGVGGLAAKYVDEDGRLIGRLCAGVGGFGADFGLGLGLGFWLGLGGGLAFGGAAWASGDG